MPSNEIADAFAECLVAGDWVLAHDLMAPWLSDRWSAAALERAVRIAGKGTPPPREWNLDISLLEYDDLKVPDGMGPPSEPFADQLTRGRFRDWICIQFQPAEDDREEFDACFDCWVATAEVGGDLCVGYIEFAESS